jgi:DNA-binding winged helix-turn-helix (wHTH) protein/Tfp pilus assembly protein PilF
MPEQHSQIYEFADFRLDAAKRLLLRDGEVVRLMPKAFDILLVLVSRRGETVSKDELFKAVWNGAFVEENNLNVNISALRKIFKEKPREHRFIVTVPGQGYKFVAETIETNSNGVNQPQVDSFFEQDLSKLEQIDTGVLEVSAQTVSRQDDSRKVENQPRLSRKTVLALLIGLILVLSVIGFLFTKKFWATSSDIKNTQRQTNNGEAYQHYQQGKLLLERKLKGDNKLALESFEKAIELDPNYATAYVGKADAKIWMFWASRSHDDITQARIAINKSLELDETNSYAHTLLCRIKVTYDWDFDAGIKECSRAIELDPNSHEAHGEWSQLLKVLGRNDEALVEIDTTVRLAPTSFNKRSRGLILYYSRRFDEAIAQFQQVSETDPNFSMASKWIVHSYEMKNDYANAFEWYLRQLKQGGAVPEEIEALKSTFSKNGWNGVLKHRIASNKPDERGKNFGFTETAIMYCQLGEIDKAFESFNEAFERRELFLTHIQREPRLDPIRSDPRFEELVKRIGLGER